MEQLGLQVRGMRDALTTCTSDLERQEIYNWLDKDVANPSILHNSSCQDCSPGTGDWIFRMKEWQDWLACKRRCLWLHGIPGAGKTVLTSYIIEHIRPHCDSSQAKVQAGILCAYYYCHHQHNQDEAPALLRWLISQLSRASGTVAQELVDTYRQGTHPSTQELVDLLATVLEADETTTFYVVLDALDETQLRHNLLNLVGLFVTDSRFSKIQLFATSRRYKEIGDVMGAISTPISMTNLHVKEDIHRFVEAKLRSEDRFQRWPEGLFKEVEDALVSKAEGMFRYAACQVDILRKKRLSSSDTIRQALRDLPKGLNETYDRIFGLIEDEDREFVRHVLGWISFQERLGGYVTPQMLIESFSKTRGKPCHYNRDDLEDVCGCLITFMKTREKHVPPETVVFAHYTVREYMSSERIAVSSAASFALDKCEDVPEFLKSIFDEAIAASDVILSHLPALRGDCFQKFELCSIVLSWRACDDDSGCADSICSDDQLFRLARQVLRPSKKLRQKAEGLDLRCRIWGHSLISPVPVASAEYHDADTVQDIFSAVLLIWRRNITLAKKWMEWLMSRMEPGDILRTAVAVHVQSPRLDLYPLGLTQQMSGRGPWHSVPDVLQMTFLGLIAQLGSPRSLCLLSGYISTSSEATDALLLHIGSHCPETESDHDKDGFSPCSVKCLLRKGADPNTPGRWATALQIATASWDLEGVEALLEHGADVDGLGDEEAGMWGSDTLMGRFNFLHDMTSLHICRNVDCVVEDVVAGQPVEEQRGGNRAKIEDLLVRRGGRDEVREGRFTEHKYTLDWIVTNGEELHRAWVGGKLKEYDDPEEYSSSDEDSEHEDWGLGDENDLSMPGKGGSRDETE